MAKNLDEMTPSELVSHFETMIKKGWEDSENMSIILDIQKIRGEILSRFAKLTALAGLVEEPKKENSSGSVNRKSMWALEKNQYPGPPNKELWE